MYLTFEKKTTNGIILFIIFNILIYKKKFAIKLGLCGLIH